MTIQGLGSPLKKEWSWSYSKLKNYNSCPKKHYEIDILKNYVEEIKPGSPLEVGNRAHTALALACQGRAALPTEFSHYQKWVDQIRKLKGVLLVEQKYAITRDFQATEYFARNAWYRGIGDVVLLDNDLAFIGDWKTGKILDESVQLMLMAQCMFSHYPQLQRVVSQFIWLKENCTTPEVFTRQDVADKWVELLPHINKLEQAAKTLDYPPKPSGLCKKWCPVQSCPFHGKGAY